MKKYILLSTALLFSGFSYAQFDFVTFGSRTVGGSNQVNPGMRLPGEITFTFPGLSMINFSTTSTLSPSDFISNQSNGKTVLDLPLLIQNAKAQNGVEGYLNYSPLFVSWHTKKNNGFFTIAYNHLFNFKGVFSDDLISYFGRGNSAFVNQNVNISDDQFALLHYHKIHLGYTHFINDRLSVGAKINGYGGFNHFEITNFSADLFTDGNSFPAYATTVNADFEAFAGGIIAPEISEGESYSFGGPGHLLGIGRGLGFDFGFEYKATENISIGAAARDIGGKIKWDEEFGRKMTFGGTGEIDFNGFETSLNAENPGAEFDRQAEELEEELREEFDLTALAEAYSSPIGKGFSFSAQYLSDNKKHTVIGLFDGKENFGALNYRGGLIYHFTPSKMVQLSAAYSSSKAAPSNIGTGLTLNFGYSQFHFSSDNIVSLFNQDNVGQVAFRFGFNIQYPPKKIIKPKDVLENEGLPEELNPADTRKYFK